MGLYREGYERVRGDERQEIVELMLGLVLLLGSLRLVREGVARGQGK